MSRGTLSAVKYASLLVFAATFVCAVYALPQHGWSPPYEEFKFWIDARPVFSSIAIVSLLVFVGAVWLERGRNGKTYPR